MRHHDLMSHNDGWRCAVCGAVFPSKMMLEEILLDECLGVSTSTLVSPAWEASMTYTLHDAPDFVRSLFLDDDRPNGTHRPDPTVRKGERLLDAWMSQRKGGVANDPQ
jgi:hypothetical protein